MITFFFFSLSFHAQTLLFNRYLSSSRISFCCGFFFWVIVNRTHFFPHSSRCNIVLIFLACCFIVKTFHLCRRKLIPYWSISNNNELWEIECRQRKKNVRLNLFEHLIGNTVIETLDVFRNTCSNHRQSTHNLHDNIATGCRFLPYTAANRIKIWLFSIFNHRYEYISIFCSNPIRSKTRRIQKKRHVCPETFTEKCIVFSEHCPSKCKY